MKILDFGLAKLTHAGAPTPAQTLATVTAPQTTPGMVLGTVGYMSPEQVRGEPVDHRADIFAFGAVLYEMLSGTPRVPRRDAADTMSAILTAEPPDLSNAAGGVLAAIAAVIRRCLEKDAHDRFQSARDLAFALEAMAIEGRSGTTVAADAT